MLSRIEPSVSALIAHVESRTDYVRPAHGEAHGEARGEVKSAHEDSDDSHDEAGD
jgi:hypothetical protein